MEGEGGGVASSHASTAIFIDTGPCCLPQNIGMMEVWLASTPPPFPPLVGAEGSYNGQLVVPGRKGVRCEFGKEAEWWLSSVSKVCRSSKEELKSWEKGTLKLAALATLTGCPQARPPAFASCVLLF